MSTQSETTIHTAASKGFGTEENTALYEAGRPSYSIPVVDMILNRTLFDRYNVQADKTNRKFTIVDVGAGTGKFSQILYQRTEHYHSIYPHIEFHLIAVEPVEGMRKRFSQVLPSISILEGSGSAIPLESNSVDLVVAAQAFHWFATAEALTEIHRVLKPNGGLALVWNTRDMENYEWVAAIDKEVDKYYAPDVPRQQTGKRKEAFQLPQTKNLFANLSSESYLKEMVQKGTADLIVARILSISVIGQLPVEEREKIGQDIRNILKTHPQTKDLTEFELPYRTDVFWTFRQ